MPSDEFIMKCIEEGKTKLLNKFGINDQEEFIKRYHQKEREEYQKEIEKNIETKHTQKPRKKIKYKIISITMPEDLHKRAKAYWGYGLSGMISYLIRDRLDGVNYEYPKEEDD